jgi:hypothetical protein
MVMKMCVNPGSIYSLGNGRGRNRSGYIEAVSEFDPDRAFEPIFADVAFPLRHGLSVVIVTLHAVA